MKSNREWLYWGREDPLWAVNSLPGRQKDSNAPWTDQEFLETGRVYFQNVSRQWKQYGLSGGHCIEIGCGSGRITLQLLTIFAHVTALDISPDQIANAKRLLGEQVERVTFVTVDRPDIPVPDQSVDGMFSCEVFQHLDGFPAIEKYLTATYAKLKPGGTICFQLPVAGIHVPNILLHSLKRVTTTAQRLFGMRRIMDYRAYGAPLVMRTLEAIGYVDCELRIFPVAYHKDGHGYFYARKPL